jgi:hypothetical protein
MRGKPPFALLRIAMADKDAENRPDLSVSPGRWLA